MNTNAERDLELWRTWKRTGAPSDLEALMHQMLPLIRAEAQKYANVVPLFVLEAEAKQLAKRAFETYSPAAGTQLNTHVVNQLKKLSRSFYERQSTVRVPEHQRITYNQYRRTAADLEDRLGYKPSIDHIADHMGLPVPKLQKLISNVEKRELLESGEGPSFAHDTDESEKIDLAYHDMTPLQKDVFDYRTGSHGKPELDNPEICARLNIPQWKLSAELVAIRQLLERAKRTHV